MVSSLADVPVMPICAGVMRLHQHPGSGFGSGIVMMRFSANPSPPITEVRRLHGFGSELTRHPLADRICALSASARTNGSFLRPMPYDATYFICEKEGSVNLNRMHHLCARGFLGQNGRRPP